MNDKNHNFIGWGEKIKKVINIKTGEVAYTSDKCIFDFDDCYQTIDMLYDTKKDRHYLESNRFDKEYFKILED